MAVRTISGRSRFVVERARDRPNRQVRVKESVLVRTSGWWSASHEALLWASCGSPHLFKLRTISAWRWGLFHGRRIRPAAQRHGCVTTRNAVHKWLRMRKINTRSFVRATWSTSRDINRQILLNLVREHQPISRADLARRMRTGRGMVTSIVDELLADGPPEGTTVDRAARQSR